MFSWNLGDTYWVKFKIELSPNAEPRVCPLPPPLKENLKFQLEDWLGHAVIEPANSPWASPLVPVKKKNNNVHWAADFRGSKSLSVDVSFPTPNILEVLETFGESKVFSTLDAQNAYHCISIEEKSRPLTAFTMTFGLY